MKTLIIIILSTMLFSCSTDHGELNARVKYWQTLLDNEVPYGTDIEKIKKWGESKNIKFDYLKQQKWLYSNVEQIPVKGIKFPCSEWNIILKIIINSNGKSIKNEVSKVGSCV